MKILRYVHHLLDILIAHSSNLLQERENEEELHEEAPEAEGVFLLILC